MRIAVLLLIGFSLCLHAQVIPTNCVIPWTPGVTVGVRGGIPSVPVWTNAVTGSYHVDNTGATDAAPGILAAWTDCPSNGAVFLPDGTYNITNGLNLPNLNGRVLRGNGSNTVLVGWINFTSKETDTPVCEVNDILPVHKGDTNITMVPMPSLWSFAVGDMWDISGAFSRTNQAFPVCNVGMTAYTLYQTLLVTAVTSSNISVWPPVVLDFTNGTILKDIAAPSAIGKRIGLEHYTIVQSNSVVVGPVAPSCPQNFGVLMDSWMYDVTVKDTAANYGIDGGATVCCQIDSCQIGPCSASGTSTGGALMTDCSGMLIQNNIFDGLPQNGFQIWGGFCGNAFFGNYFTNVSGNGDIFYHVDHSAMNLYEQNKFAWQIIHDGYTSSSSHAIYLRNQAGPWGFVLKRWVSNVAIVGNVVPTGTGYPMVYSRYETGSGFNQPFPIMYFGYPNIGNNAASDFSPPVDMNYPGTNWNSYGVNNNGSTVLTNTQLLTTNLQGNFSWLTLINGNPAATPLLFQDTVNTNNYYPYPNTLGIQPSGGIATWNNDGTIYAEANGTSSNLLINIPLTVSNGWRVWVGGVGFFQHITTNLLATLTVTGNSVVTNVDGVSSNVVWDANGVQAIPDSLLYPGGPNAWPSLAAWWGTNRWPAIGVDKSPMITHIPAENRFNGQQNGTNVAPVVMNMPPHILGVMQ